MSKRSCVSEMLLDQIGDHNRADRIEFRRAICNHDDDLAGVFNRNFHDALALASALPCRSSSISLAGTSQKMWIMDAVCP